MGLEYGNSYCVLVLCLFCFDIGLVRVYVVFKLIILHVVFIIIDGYIYIYHKHVKGYVKG